ncbi:MAG: YcaO-like family protein [Nitriliruptoraceae bacterium]|nr:YcaO-like family protein [Nitriliruptoraceae bacterium]
MNRLDLAVDPRVGIVTGLDAMPLDPALPDRLRLWSARVADTAVFGPWWADRVATGMAFDDDRAARSGAIGEALERYCANRVPRGLERTSFAALQVAGRDALDPRHCALYADRQHHEPGFPFVPLTADLEVAWAAGRSLPSGEATLVPASLVYANYFLPPRDREPPTNALIYAGLAAGRDRAHAQANALEELVERDATMIWWHGNGPVIHLTPPATLRAAVASTADPRLRWTWLLLPTRLGLPVVACLVEDPELGFSLLGVAARPSAEAAATKAAAEAAALWSLGVGLLTPGSPVWSAIDEHRLLDRSLLKPWDPDRAYRQAYRDDWHDVVDLVCQTQLYLDPAMDPFLAPLRDPDETRPLASVPATSPTDADRLAQVIAAHTGHAPVAVDLTTPDVASTGVQVTRIVAPGLLSNAPAAFPLLGGTRLYEEPVARGGRPHPRAPAERPTPPLPHT